MDKEGLTWEMKGQLEKALDSYDRLLAEVEAVSPTSQRENNEKKAIIAYLLMRKAGILLETGKLESGNSLMNKALVYAQESGNLLILNRAKLGLGVLYASTRKFNEGEKLLKEALSGFNQSTDYDNRQGAGWALLNLGGLYLKQEKLDLAEEKLIEAIKSLETIENWVGVATAYEFKVKHDQIRGDLALAKQDLLNAIAFYEKQGMKEKADSLKNSVKNMNATNHRG
ncbi:MAG TPA: tetratricopeptide repeat protein [Candidatus Bathyarchaeia archaeon]|nr:tetratricopeptide repeat protein [Candidatus Bathyarchaeia archaeon]